VALSSAPAMDPGRVSSSSIGSAGFDVCAIFIVVVHELRVRLYIQNPNGYGQPWFGGGSTWIVTETSGSSFFRSSSR